MKKEVVFDLLFAQPIGDSKFHGGGEYIKTVFHALAERYQGEYPLIACYDQDRFIDEWILTLIEQKGIQKQDVKTAANVVAYVGDRSREASVRFFAGMVYPYDAFSFPENVTCIGTCHGLRMLEKLYDRYAPLYILNQNELKDMIRYTVFHQRYWQKAWSMYYNAMKNFNVLVTDSEHSANSIRVNFPEFAAKKKIHVFYAPEKYVAPLKMEASMNPQPHILMISANRWLKNSCRGVLALDGLYQKGYLKGVKTKVLGNLPERIQKRVKCKDCFEFLGYVSPEKLEMAYRDCELFFYPTLNEGFGLPPMEAMKYGKTCVISNVCSLPEVYGDSVYYCNPYDIMEMQGRILQAMDGRIDQAVIERRLKEVHDRQNKDLCDLCSVISGVPAIYALQNRHKVVGHGDRKI